MENMDFKELRRLGRESLTGKWGLAIGCTILYILFNSLFDFFADAPLDLDISLFLDSAPKTESSIVFFPKHSAIDWVSLIWNVLTTGGLILGTSLIFLNICRNQPAHIRQLFYYFTSGKLLLRGIMWHVIQSIYLMLWSLLFIIPGIIKWFSYSMTPYILIDHPELSINEAITKSREIMNGHKMELFALQLSFIGWLLLSLLTIGVGFIWLIPYYSATEAQFYRKIKGEMNTDQKE
ncbi:DUF975 family protein [Polycladomyces subterraneus]|uniref:DUF975 family protein n=1 Tax=Polycladomyces subterraneus TaxID=1016997 RepID=A0ABT8IM64_9BACL|nr:DUF975 family protein [Polycladomyces subterraneus]MDN4593872.1 DUF975 family protein [Polycladomyces subterraneus]